MHFFDNCEKHVFKKERTPRVEKTQSRAARVYVLNLIDRQLFWKQYDHNIKSFCWQIEIGNPPAKWANNEN